jgi:hypothetical protein
MENHPQIVSPPSRARWLFRATRGICFFAFIACSRADSGPPPDIQPLARIDLDSSRTVEIIGLRRWTADMVRDSLKKYAPDDGLDSDAAAANLRNLLGFADAATSVHTVVFDEDDKATITLAVREPTDSDRVHYEPQTLDTVPQRAEWQEIAQALYDTTGRMLPMVAAAHLDGLSRLVVDSMVRGRTHTHREGYAFESPSDSLAVMPILAKLADKKSPADFDAAVRTIDSSTSEPDRAVAALILANFPDRDGAWRALLKAAVGREQARDAFIAQHALVAMSQRGQAKRSVDWSPLIPTIHNVLDGTALAALAPLATALTATGANATQAPGYLANGGEMLAAYVESDNPDIRDAAHDLLVKLRGQDLGFDPGPWRDWIGGLRAPGAEPT